MVVLNRNIAKKDWINQVDRRNGAAHTLGNRTTDPEVPDAGAWEPAVQQIVGFQHLGDDWDGFGAEAPSADLLASAIGLAYTLLGQGVDPPHRVAPGVRGSVIFEWQDPDGSCTEVEIDRPLHAEVMVVELGKPPTQWTIPTQ
jgi:hypothetical protein